MDDNSPFSETSGAQNAVQDDTQPCPVCNFPIGTRAGSKEAICTNCGYKDPCCD